MTGLIASMLDATRLLFDLQRANEIAQRFSACLDPIAIARYTTDDLVERFGCAFARIWLVEPDRATLRLVASSGLYTRTDGSFARVPMGAYKVGKIAQNRVSFLSNHLADESWVKDREWAISNQIQGFAGFPLTVGDRVIGVLAVFSHDAMAPEFLEVLQFLCTMVSVSLETALHYQRETRSSLSPAADISISLRQFILSDQLAAILQPVRLTLIGTEQPLPPSHTYLFLQVAEVLHTLNCRYCRLLYQDQWVVLEAIATSPDSTCQSPDKWVRSHFGLLSLMAPCLGGSLQSETIVGKTGIQVSFKLPYPRSTAGDRLRIHCRIPALHLAFNHLAHAAGLQVCESQQDDVPLLTDDPTQLSTVSSAIWIQYGVDPVPQGVQACVPLSIGSEQLREVVNAVQRGETWGIQEPEEEMPGLSEREREILGLLAQGLRDRDIANHLIISESTVKFHINNVLSKFKARTRFQALYQAVKRGWV